MIERERIQGGQRWERNKERYSRRQRLNAARKLGSCLRLNMTLPRPHSNVCHGLHDSAFTTLGTTVQFLEERDPRFGNRTS
jgi:hypothetical protein